MAQSVPSVLFHSQAIKLIEQLVESYRSGVTDVDDMAQRLREALTAFENTVGVPFTDFEPVVEGEPPLSAKMNRLWRAIADDINILQRQIDVTRAASLFTHNLIKTETLRVGLGNARVANKLKTLQLYSKAVDSSVVVFGDRFRSEEFIDFSRISSSDRVEVVADGYVTLAQLGGLDDLGADAGISVLATSNGFLGNLHELQAGSDLAFKAEVAPRRRLGNLTDAEPGTWIEYEQWQVSEVDRRRAGNLGFTYHRQGTEGLEYVDWAVGPSGGVLRLDLEFDLGSPETINFISLVPYDLEDNSNFPLKVRLVETSPNGTEWQSVRPAEIYVGTTPTLNAARTADEVQLGVAVWAFAGRQARYVRLHLEQAQPIAREMGHVYYLDEAGQRQQGPVPSVTDPAAAYQPAAAVAGKLTQHREVFLAKRWVIGIRDIAITSRNYAQESVLISRPLRVGGVVDRVTLEADVSIPSEYDSTASWISFYVSPDDGATWFSIARIQDDYLGLPEVLAFNDPMPESFREPGVAYINVPGAVTTLRLKIVLRRPSDMPSTTPVLHSYELKARRR